MTDLTPVDEGSSQALLAEAMELYTTAAKTFALVVREAREGAPQAGKEATGYAKEFRAALQAVLNERATIDKLRKQELGAAGACALDFAAARDEIGRRLACLRDAGGGG
ncbi:hypothetical protein ABIE69_000607 [Rhodobacteraceae bacterium MBR-64]|jgi:hypothetical protein